MRRGTTALLSPYQGYVSPLSLDKQVDKLLLRTQTSACAGKYQPAHLLSLLAIPPRVVPNALEFLALLFGKPGRLHKGSNAITAQQGSLWNADAPYHRPILLLCCNVSLPVARTQGACTTDDPSVVDVVVEAHITGKMRKHTK